MTRVIVHGGDVDDPAYVHNVLQHVNKVYGPITCVIHSNNVKALAWQQWVARRQVTRHLPIVANWSDGTAVWSRLYTRLFDQGRPDYLVLIQPPVLSAEEIGRIRELTYRADRRGVPVLKFEFEPSEPGAIDTELVDQNFSVDEVARFERLAVA
jgi:hypothetical protein